MKELFIVCGTIIYILFLSLKNWGKKFPFIGLNANDFHHFITIQTVPTEEKCRRIFEEYFGLEFPKCRPDFLRNPKTGRCLELDGFNDSIVTDVGIGLAFEYNGAQHYWFVPKFHRTQQDLEDQIERDTVKRNICTKRGILLFIIPYTITDDKLEKFIVEQIYDHKLYVYKKRKK
jgi:hypothetical protein